MIKEIFEFNNMLGYGPKPVCQMDHKAAMFNVKAIREEAQELEDEHLHVVVQDIAALASEAARKPIIYEDPQSEDARWQTVKSVDAVIDAAYFAIGAMARTGLTVEQAQACFLAVHEANMTKKRGVAASRGDMGVTDAAKPVNFVPPDQRIYQILFGEKNQGMEPGTYGGYTGE